jgi:hypothetical protein
MFTETPMAQELVFTNGSKRIIRNIIKIEQGNWFHLLTKDGTEYIIPPNKLLFVRAWEEED